MRLLPALALALSVSFGAASLAASAADPAAKPAGKYQVVFHISGPEQVLWGQALNNAASMMNNIGKENIELEVVVHGEGIGMLMLDSPQATRVSDAMKAGVKFVACQQTMKFRKLTKDDMLPDIGYVPAGVKEILDKQRAGWQYLKG